jgi:hypothetical protein
MQRLTRSLLAVAALTITLSLNAAPHVRKAPRAPRQPDVQQAQKAPSPWLRLIHKILDDVIPPPDNRGSIPPG